MAPAQRRFASIKKSTFIIVCQILCRIILVSSLSPDNIALGPVVHTRVPVSQKETKPTWRH